MSFKNYFALQHSVSPELAIHGIPVDNFSRTTSGGVNLSRFSAGIDLSEPASSNWSSKTSVKFEVHLIQSSSISKSYFYCSSLSKHLPISLH